MCEEYESLHERSGRPDMVMGQSIVLSAIKTEVSLDCDDPAYRCSGVETHRSVEERGRCPGTEELRKTTCPKKHRAAGGRGENRRCRRRSDGRDLPGSPQHEAHRAARVAHEGHGVGDVLHAVPTKRARHRERNARGRQSIQRAGDKQIKRAGSPCIWFFNAMLETFGKTLTNNIKNGRSSLQDQGTQRQQRRSE